MKILSLLVCFIIFLCGCAASGNNSSNPDTNSKISDNSKITDINGNSATLTKDSKIAACYGSFAECLTLAGLEPVGVTEDAIEDHGLEFSSDTKIVGTVKEINLEQLTQSNPDYVMLSADLSAHLNLEESLKELGFSYGYFRIDTFSDYKAFMKTLCDISKRDDLYEENVTKPEKNIENILAKVPENQSKDFLLMRAYSSGIKAKGDDNLAGQLLKELGAKNIADSHLSILEELSIEQIIEDDPEFIFVSFMGSEKAAKEYLKENFENNPAFASLTAVKNSNYILLPKDLFHYKPNNRWDESYEYLAKILYPEVFE